MATQHEVAEMVAELVGGIAQHTARVWDGGDHVRVYVRGPYSRKGDGGYLEISEDGTLDGREVRLDVLRALSAAGRIPASWASDVSRIEVVS